MVMVILEGDDGGQYGTGAGDKVEMVMEGRW